jgi:D-methionine transport system substrate-binding protein
MKKNFLRGITALGVSLAILASCSEVKPNKEAITVNEDTNVTSKIVIGVTPVPHSHLMNFIIDDLKELNIDLEVKEFSSYALLNSALANGDIDANFFQHLPYLENDNKMSGNNLVSLGAIHIEPIGAYSSKITDILDLKEGSTISIPDDTSGEGRALLLLQKFGIITVDPNTGLEATPIDIIENPKNLKFVEMPAEQLTRTLADVDIAIINTNYALEAELNPETDSLIIEEADSPYVNVIVVRETDKDLEIFKKLMEVAQSSKMADYIKENYGNSISVAY